MKSNAFFKERFKGKISMINRHGGIGDDTNSIITATNYTLRHIPIINKSSNMLPEGSGCIPTSQGVTPKSSARKEYPIMRSEKSVKILPGLNLPQFCKEQLKDSSRNSPKKAEAGKYETRTQARSPIGSDNSFQLQEPVFKSIDVLARMHFREIALKHIVPINSSRNGYLYNEKKNFTEDLDKDFIIDASYSIEKDKTTTGMFPPISKKDEKGYAYKYALKQHLQQNGDEKGNISQFMSTKMKNKFEEQIKRNTKYDLSKAIEAANVTMRKCPNEKGKL